MGAKTISNISTQIPCVLLGPAPIQVRVNFLLAKLYTLQRRNLQGRIYGLNRARAERLDSQYHDTLPHCGKSEHWTVLCSFFKTLKTFPISVSLIQWSYVGAPAPHNNRKRPALARNSERLGEVRQVQGNRGPTSSGSSSSCSGLQRQDKTYISKDSATWRDTVAYTYCAG